MLKKFKNMKIGKRLNLTFTCILLMFAVIIAAAIIGSVSIGNSLNKFYNQPYEMTQASLKASMAFESMDKYIYMACATLDLNETDNALTKVNEAYNKLVENWEIIKVGYEGDSSHLTNFETYMQQARPIRENILELAAVNDDNVMNLMKTEYSPLIVKAQESLDQIVNTVAEKAVFYKNNGNQIKMVVILLIAILAVIILLFILVVSNIIIHSINDPITEIQAAVNQITEGNLQVDISYKADDELGYLAHDLRNTIANLKMYVYNIDEVLGKLANKDMTVSVDIDYKGDFASIKKSMIIIVEALSETMKHISEAINQVSIGSDQIATAAQSVAQGATDQSASVEELLATVNEISEQVQKNAEDAENVNTISKDTVQRMDNGNEYMNELLTIMDKISKQGEEIAKITGVISGIASQTNMLSLNASIEAARAGEHGKGFAVVANEIGNLANESAEATKTIASLIDETIRVVREGTNMANDTAAALKNAVQSTNESGSLIQNITEACMHQSDSLKEVVEGIQSITSVVESNSAVAEEASASSQELLSEVEQVVGMLEEFKL